MRRLSILQRVGGDNILYGVFFKYKIFYIDF